MSDSKRCCLCSTTNVEGFTFDNGNFVCEGCLICARCGHSDDAQVLVGNYRGSQAILCGECVMLAVNDQLAADYQREHPELY